MRVFDEVGQKRDRRHQREIPGGREEPAARRPCQQDQQHTAQRRRQAQRPFRLTERFHGGGHHVQLPDRAGVIHAARQLRGAVFDKVHRRQAHGLLVAVQADIAQAPETHRRSGDDDERPQQSCPAHQAGVGIAEREQRGKSGQEFCDHRVDALPSIGFLIAQQPDCGQTQDLQVQ